MVLGMLLLKVALVAVIAVIGVEMSFARIVLVNGGFARVANAYGRRQVMIGQRVELVGAFVAEYLATVAAMVFS